jgi:hypothetical protein
MTMESQKKFGASIGIAMAATIALKMGYAVMAVVAGIILASIWSAHAIKVKHV